MPFSHIEDGIEQIAEGRKLQLDEELTLKQIYEQIGMYAWEICQEVTTRGRMRVQLLKDTEEDGEEQSRQKLMLKYLEESLENREKVMEAMLEMIGAEPRIVMRKGGTEVPIGDISIRIRALRVLKLLLNSYSELLGITDLDTAQKIMQLVAHLEEIRRSKQGSN